jgi:hypothetical protein
MKRTITFEPAYDKRHPDPKKNYGIHGVTIRFVLQGKEGAVQLVLYTDWFLPHVQEELHNRGDHGGVQSWRNGKPWFAGVDLKPIGADIGYHSAKPLHKWQKKSQPSQAKCHILGTPCWYDGSTLRASEVGVPALLSKGSDGVWALLKEEYDRVFKPRRK